uniref:Uncharacterized protein n=1 Tax=Arundo donax TaxID=35708 RepID=A0A0A9EL47_ARUDO
MKWALDKANRKLIYAMEKPTYKTISSKKGLLFSLL